jgi:hypothetical protein
VTIKTFVIISKKPGISEDEFHDHWRYPHATWGCRMTTLQGYVQAHRVACDALSGIETAFDGVAEAWFVDEATAGAFRQEPVLEQYLKPDEPLFIEMESLAFVVTVEEVIDEPAVDAANPKFPASIWSPWRAPTSIKLLQFIAAEAGPDWSHDDDLDLGRQLGALRHIRCRPSYPVHGDDPPFAGVRELQLPTMHEFRRGLSGAPRPSRL